VFEERRGYANFFFNRLEQQRVWNGFQAHVNLVGNESPWTMEGTRDDKEFIVRLDDELAEGRLNGVFEQVDFGSVLSDELSPRKSGGLLLALHQWRSLLVSGQDKFGDVYYLGSAPLPGYEGLLDVLVGTYDTLETRFYFDSQSNQLVGLEMYPDLNVDPCELRFRQPVDGLPTVVDVQFGDKIFAPLKIDRFETNIAPTSSDEGQERR